MKRIDKEFHSTFRRVVLVNYCLCYQCLLHLFYSRFQICHFLTQSFWKVRKHNVQEACSKGRPLLSLLHTILNFTSSIGQPEPPESKKQAITNSTFTLQIRLQSSATIARQKWLGATPAIWILLNIVLVPIVWNCYKWNGNGEKSMRNAVDQNFPFQSPIHASIYLCKNGIELKQEAKTNTIS